MYTDPAHVPFLKAILANVEDDVPRLVYADWLEARGDPLGEFIRIQCQLAQMAPADPRRPELAVREAQVLHEHRPDWLGWTEIRTLWPPLKRVRFRCFGQCRSGEMPVANAVWSTREVENPFRRGFVEGLQVCPEEFVDRWDAILRVAPLVQHVHVEFDDRLVTAPHLSQVKSLYLYGDIGARGARALAACPYLRGLNALFLSGAKVGVAGAEALAASPHLTNLKNLQIWDSEVGPERVQALAASPHLANLTALNLKSNRILDEGLRALSRSAN